MNGPPRLGHRFTAAEVAALRSAPGRDALAAAGELVLDDRSLLGDLARLRRSCGDLAAAAAETVRLRRRATAKFGPEAAGWLLTEAALQQGTPAAVARHRAGRFAAAGTAVHDLTCSIGADLAALSGAVPVAVGSDLDPVRVAMAAHNLGDAARSARVFVADALTRTSRGLLGYADPARRDQGGRRVGPADLQPSPHELDRVHAHRPPVLRMPPGVDHVALARPGEAELVSLDGDVREAVLWPPELAGPSRRATVLRTGAPGWEISSDDPEDRGTGPVGRWIVDPDGAVVRAGLVTHYAARHGLHLLDPHLAYLTGDRPPPGVRAFRVLDHAPLRPAVVAGWIRRDGAGTLEILQRGTSVVPDELRRRLRPALRPHDTAVAATLVVARVGDRPQAFWCRAERS
ncbi:THUMP-like domain-containing protein [Nakamurella endophytica]|uniref:THUMP-like domain-containing protein n=1 Tax=Nakamurella endophytica TaxID=1748367 RepID=A0A917SQ02_9ACTN|nr:hypothetical protein [Nakamurella endophytica]GGL90773.1 hypothetical protein GCM10011594_07980 [Nakamurella endophytica]